MSSFAIAAAAAQAMTEAFARHERASAKLVAGMSGAADGDPAAAAAEQIAAKAQLSAAAAVIRTHDEMMRQALNIKA